MDAGAPYNPRTVEEVFRDFKGRRAAMIKALTTGFYLSNYFSFFMYHFHSIITCFSRCDFFSSPVCFVQMLKSSISSVIQVFILPKFFLQINSSFFSFQLPLNTNSIFFYFFFLFAFTGLVTSLFETFCFFFSFPILFRDLGR